MTFMPTMQTVYADQLVQTFSRTIDTPVLRFLVVLGKLLRFPSSN